MIPVLGLALGVSLVVAPPTAAPRRVRRPAAADSTALRICGDPGNMPLSNVRGEGFQNKVAEVLARALGMRLEYFWYTYYERGLLRNTLNGGNCDVLMDVPDDFDGALTTRPYYRSTYVLAYRTDRGLHITSLDDSVLKRLRIGVFQTSPARDVLREHGIVANTVVHYVFYDSYYHPEQHPGEQVDAVIAGTLDAATAWGPIAGYAVARQGAPLTLLPLNTFDTSEPLDFAMSLAVRRADTALKAQLDRALAERRDEIREILTNFGVPLVRCDSCAISGDLPAQVLRAVTPPTPPATPGGPSGGANEPRTADDSGAAVADLRRRLAAGADPTAELLAAIEGHDAERIRYLLDHGAHLDSLGTLGYDGLHEAIREQDSALVALLIAAGAGLEVRDREGWTPLMLAVWDRNHAIVRELVAKGARVNAVGGKGWSPLALAVTYDTTMIAPLLASGADVNATNDAGYTPLMFAVVTSATATVDRLLAAGANAGAANRAGMTGLMLAAMRDDAPMVTTLLRSRIGLNDRNAAGDTALQIAQRRHFDDIVALLTGAGAKPTT